MIPIALRLGLPIEEDNVVLQQRSYTNEATNLPALQLRRNGSMQGALRRPKRRIPFPPSSATATSSQLDQKPRWKEEKLRDQPLMLPKRHSEESQSLLIMSMVGTTSRRGVDVAPRRPHRRTNEAVLSILQQAMNLGDNLA